MDTGERDISPLRVLPKTIEAGCYNQVRLALLRIGDPLRIDLPDHRALEVILNKKHWLCVDTSQDDQRIMMWSEFDTRKHNSALHEDVPCSLYLYHMHAGLIMGTALEALCNSLNRITQQ